jgi:hypothetical protein
MQCSERPFPGRSASVTAGKTTLQNFRRRIESGSGMPPKASTGAENPRVTSRRGCALQAWPRSLGPAPR